MLNYRNLYINTFAKINIQTIPYRLLVFLLEYKERSLLAGKTNQWYYFEPKGGYSGQWAYLGGILGFYRSTDDIIKLKTGPRLTNMTKVINRYKKNVNIINRREVLLFNRRDRSRTYEIPYLTLLKYRNRPNNSFHITYFKKETNPWTSLFREPERDESVWAGKNGEFSKSKRRKYTTLFSWWVYLFTKIHKQITWREEYINEISTIREPKHYLTIQIQNMNRGFIKFFFFFKSLFIDWNRWEFFFDLYHYWWQNTYYYKKKRYIKKYRRRALLTNDRVRRRFLNVFDRM